MSKSILRPVPPPPPQMTEKILKNNTLEVIMSFLKGLNENDKKVFYTKFAKKYKNTDKLLETIENCKTLQEHKELNLNVKNMIEDYMRYILRASEIEHLLIKNQKRRNQFLQQLSGLFGICI